MFKFLFIPILFLNSLLFSDGEKPRVLVSVAPYCYFVEKISGGALDVDLMVPEAASAHTFEPTAKQMMKATSALIWFKIGEPFEKKAIEAVKSVRKDLVIIDLRKNIPLLHGSCKHAHPGGSCGEDLHLWLSPKIAKIQAETIAQALIDRFPEKKEIFSHGLKTFISELSALDQFIQETLHPIKNRVILVSHPAYAYFCQQYQFEQLSIEFEGRDPTSRQLTSLLTSAKDSKVGYILVQPQYSDKAARLIGNQIGAKLVVVDPYSADYDATLRHIAKVIADNS